MSSGIVIEPFETVLNVKDGSLDPCWSIFLFFTFPIRDMWAPYCPAVRPRTLDRNWVSPFFNSSYSLMIPSNGGVSGKSMSAIDISRVAQILCRSLNLGSKIPRSHDNTTGKGTSICLASCFWVRNFHCRTWARLVIQHTIYENQI